MIMQIIILYLLYCFTAFFLIFSRDEAKLWGELKTHDIPKLSMPHISDIDIENKRSWELQSYVNNFIIPSTLYFSLLNDIKKLQSDCDDFFISGVFIQLFLIATLSQSFIKSNFVNNWLIAVIISIGICFISYFVLSKIYEKSKYKINHFSFVMYDEYKDIDIIKEHYTYLCTIKHTIWLRYCLRKILSTVSFVIYVLFFFTVPSYYR